MEQNAKVVLVTGASSGIGQAVAQLMAKEGFAVYGTSRRAEYQQIGADDEAYTMLPMTLEDEASIEAAVQYIKERHGRIDVLVNAAGSGIAGAVEETTAAEARTQFDVCFFGIVSVLSSVLPIMREQGSGTVINIGSMASVFPIPFQAMYSAVKSALLVMTQALRLELEPFGVRACVVEPGDTRTGFTDKRVFTKKSAATAYKQPLERALYEMIRSEMAAEGPERCAKAVLKAARMKKPPARVSVGFDYKLFYVISRLVPLSLKECAVRMMYLKNDPPKDAVWTYDKQFKEK